jgi:hypothetical protein
VHRTQPTKVQRTGKQPKAAVHRTQPTKVQRTKSQQTCDL